MSKRFLFAALFTFVFGLTGVVRADEAAKTPAPSSGECPHMKAMRDAQAQGKGGECPHMKDGKPCDCPHQQAGKEGKEGGGCPHMKAGKEGGECPHMKDGKPCDCKNDKPGKQPAKADKAVGKKSAKVSAAAEAKGAKE